ncbi:hypothetical protein DM02DRAFT_574850 [Periconia macrospinosa]|uniref:MYND-type domain-containing protein n=1 Tax=Periconia macrospinosa TaxID=97972 RepID=A0A2V1D6C3_9PLEO|nr:hypothetical protein DM02DRAFT_574850 [Periconia macrospinosa]
MEQQLLCTICGSSTARYCGGCRSAAYCSAECQQTDWGTHKYLCRAFSNISNSSFASRPSPNHFLGIYFPMINSSCKPELRWLHAKEIESGYFDPDLDQLLSVPGQSRYIGRGVQIVRGNILRSRPKFPDSLNIWYLDEQFVDDDLVVNETLHGGPRAVCADGWGDTFWKGPIVAFLKAGDSFDAPKMTDINLTAYRDAIDYLGYFIETVGSMIFPGPSSGLSKRVMDDRSGKVKGVRINCISDQAGDISRQFVQVEVPKTHALFGMQGDDPLEMVMLLDEDESWSLGRYPSPKNATLEGDYNPYAAMLLMDVSKGNLENGTWGGIPEWRKSRATGSVLVVDNHKEDLEVEWVRAVCMAIENHVVPLINRPAVEPEEVWNALTEEVVEQYL